MNRLTDPGLAPVTTWLARGLVHGAFASALILVGAAPAPAQSTATLQGTVTDAQNAAIPGATVVVRNTATGGTRTITTDRTGNYVAASLPPGPYRVDVKLEGFGSQGREVTLEVGTTAQLDVQLALGGVTEQVSVTGGSPILDTRTTSVSTVINQRTVQEIPLNGRHFVDLGLLIPGSVTPPQSGFLTAPLRGQGSFAFNTAGNREDTVNFMINGVNLNDMVQNQITFQPSINTVQEFKVDNSTFSAEYGRNSGAIVNIATRSGANAFHGEGFEFLRNHRFDSRNRFNAPPARQSPFKRNQFGASLGGPIVRDHAFFFWSYEGLRQRQGIDINSGVLSDTQRSAVVDPISRRLLEYIPSANAVGPRGEGRYLGSATAPVDIDQGTGDYSQVLTPNDTVHGYYAFQRDQRGEPTLQGNTIPGFGDTRRSHRQIMTLNETHVFGPHVVNEARFGFNRINITFEPNRRLNPADLGMNVGVTSAIGLPQITIFGPGLNFGGPAGFPQGRTDTSFSASNTATLSKGIHTLKIGGEFRYFENVNFTSDTGSFNFGSVADFQAGLGNNFSIVLGDRPSDVRVPAGGLFAQDTVKATSSLTFELGLRLDSNRAPSDSQNRFVVFDAATASLVRVGAGRDRVYATSHDLSPRLGVIWDPFNDGRTAVRAAYARMVDQPVTNVVTPLASNPPLATPLGFFGPIRLASAAATARAGGLTPASVNPDFHGGHIQSWNVNVERQLATSTSVMAGYFGSKGSGLRISRNINQLVNGARPFRAVSAGSSILPGTPLGNIIEISSAGVSHYKGLWLSANQKMARGLQFNASYTLSKSTDYNSLNSQGVVVQDSFNLADSLGPSDFDARHRFVVSTIYELPFRGHVLVEGWQLNLIVQAQTGNPISVVTNSGAFTGLGNTVRPDMIGQLRVLRDPNQWFSNGLCDPSIVGSCTSSSVFALPVSAAGAFHFGNLPRNAVYGPGFGTSDLSLVKNTPLSGSARLQLRVEVFNLFNRANFGQPGRIATVGSTSFGVITNTRFPTGDSGSSRQVQFAAKILF
jgi:hypothetical protein